MEKYLGIGFIILCLAVLVGIIGIFRYRFYIDKEKADIKPALLVDTDDSQNND